MVEEGTGAPPAGGDHHGPRRPWQDVTVDFIRKAIVAIGITNTSARTTSRWVAGPHLPGHPWSRLTVRARGAQVTDIVVLVIARRPGDAPDEAVSRARNAGVHGGRDQQVDLPSANIPGRAGTCCSTTWCWRIQRAGALRRLSTKTGEVPQLLGRCSSRPRSSTSKPARWARRRRGLEATLDQQGPLATVLVGGAPWSPTPTASAVSSAGSGLFDERAIR